MPRYPVTAQARLLIGLCFLLVSCSEQPARKQPPKQQSETVQLGRPDRIEIVKTADLTVEAAGTTAIPNHETTPSEGGTIGARGAGSDNGGLSRAGVNDATDPHATLQDQPRQDSSIRWHDAQHGFDARNHYRAAREPSKSATVELDRESRAAARTVPHQTPALSPAASAEQTTTYCAASGTDLTAEECNRYDDPARFSSTGQAALSAPSQMTRGETENVRFVVVQGTDQASATQLAMIDANKDNALGSVRYSRRMEADLSGEGFTIKPLSTAIVDAGSTEQASWEWSILPLRGPKHYIRVNAWVLRKEGDSYVRGLPLHYPPFEIAVPVRWFPDRLEDAEADTVGVLSATTKWILGLGALIVALGTVVFGIKNFGKKGDAS